MAATNHAALQAGRDRANHRRTVGRLNRLADALLGWPRGRPRTLAALARAVGDTTPAQVKVDLIFVGFPDWATGYRTSVYVKLGRDANRERFAKERADSVAAGWPPVTRGQRHWLAALASLGAATSREWAAAVGKSLWSARNRRSPLVLLRRAGHVVGRWEGKGRFVYRPARHVTEGRIVWQNTRAA